ncbi:MAG: hypothetical protein FJZ75_09975 [Bacteroidetes bacterium]|nr:hypothetical protein [Bacteroidota bacterium]
MKNFIEEIIGEYYKMRGYIVTTNYWIPFTSKRERKRKNEKEEYFAQSWTDIDVLARNKKELLLIQVKAGINTKEVASKVNEHFNRVELFLNKGLAPDGKSSIDWWSKSCTVKRIVVYEDRYSPPSYLKIIQSKGSETILFDTYLKEIIEYIDAKHGVKESSAGMRLLHYLNNNKYLNR